MAISDISSNAREVLKRRYLGKDTDGNVIEDIEGMFRRVADAVASADRSYDENADIEETGARFFELMTSLRFLPNSPTLMNAGRPLGQLSACFVLPVGDSMEEIFDAVKNAALIHKSGGGTGFSFSRLRPKGATVRTTGGVASGPVSFMKVFNVATEAVKQGGTRRGANMGILRIDHPDILEFIRCKQDNSEINNFNISVGLTEEFMKAAENREEYELIDPKSGIAVDHLNAGKVFEEIVDAAWKNGEPGIIFLDRLNRDNIVPARGEIESTNPCGEQPLLPYESCNLGSINLTRMVRRRSDGSCEIDYDLLAATVEDAVHFLDNVIDINNYPLKKIRDTTRGTRKIGLGVMGFADLLLLLNIPYNSPEGVALADKLMSYINSVGHAASIKLARQRGAFPLFGESIYADGEPLRNGTVTTIAPTGTISMIAGCSSGVEPIFAYVYVRNVMDGTELIEVNPILRQRLQEAGVYSDELRRKIARDGTIAHCEEIPEEIRRVFVCAHDIAPVDHINMQAAFQQHTDNAVSKTVNFKNDATREDVARVYRLAYESGCKGVTIYRDGSRDNQVLNIGRVNNGKTEETQPFGELEPRPRPAVTRGFTEKMKIGCGNLYITVNYDENGICEVFTSTGKAGGCPSQSEATARLASVALRSGLSINEVYDQLKGIRCPSTIRQQGMNCTSCPDAIAKVLMKVSRYIDEDKDGGVYSKPDSFQSVSGASPVGGPRGNEAAPAGAAPSGEPVVPAAASEIHQCPECGGVVEHEGGCVICRSCGFSKCG
ncbi:MAG: vitamin B12-dependent ribonucleotide reductase [Anaerovoracaceae bacterium]|jgi:ribonucleoside-diphosphate reductase alpha chain